MACGGLALIPCSLSPSLPSLSSLAAVASGQELSEEEIERIVEQGEGDQIFQKAIHEQVGPWTWYGVLAPCISRC